MLKVLHYIPSFLYGGIESMFLSWYRNIDKSHVEFELLLRTQDDEASALQQYRAMGGKYYRLPSLGKIKSVNTFRKAVAQFFREHHDYDIVHVHCAGLFVIYYAKKYGIKVIVHSHTSHTEKDWKSYCYRMDDIAEALLYADRAMACSELAAQWKFGGLQFKGKPVTIIHNAIDAQAFDYNLVLRQKMRQQLGWQDKFVLGHIGRMTPPKNQFYLLDIFEEVVKLRGGAILVMVGDGPDEQNLRNYALTKGIADKVLFLGVRSDTATLYQAMDCFLLPSRWEGLPVTLIEAQAAGLPCYISDVISPEADLTSLVQRLSIQDSTKKWAHAIVDGYGGDRRTSTLALIRERGFDVRREVGKLIHEYHEVMK